MEKAMLIIDWSYVLDVTWFLLLSLGCIAVVIILLLVAASSIHGMYLFKYDRNPHRRRCRKCGQQQEAYGRTYNKSYWWEDCLPVPDEDCGCHLHSTYHA